MNAVFVIDLESAVAHLVARPGVPLVGVDLVRNTAQPLVSAKHANEFFAGRERVAVVPLVVTDALVKALENIKRWALNYDRRQRNMPDGLGGYGEIADEAHDALMAYEKARGK